MLASDAKTVSIFHRAHAGLGCDSCGNANDTQIKLPYTNHLENDCSSLPHVRKALRFAVDFSHKPQKAWWACRYLCMLWLRLCCCSIRVVEFNVHPAGISIQVAITLRSDSIVVIYSFYPLYTSLATSFVFQEMSQTHCYLQQQKKNHNIIPLWSCCYLIAKMQHCLICIENQVEWPYILITANTKHFFRHAQMQHL